MLVVSGHRANSELASKRFFRLKKSNRAFFLFGVRSKLHPKRFCNKIMFRILFEAAVYRRLSGDSPVDFSIKALEAFYVIEAYQSQFAIDSINKAEWLVELRNEDPELLEEIDFLIYTSRYWPESFREYENLAYSCRDRPAFFAKYKLLLYVFRDDPVMFRKIQRTLRRHIPEPRQRRN